jgi:hypothetical protein
MMRFDLPHEMPNPRKMDATPLKPSPVEQRRERLAERVGENRASQAPQPRRERPIESARPRAARTRSIPPSHERLVDRRPWRRRVPVEALHLALRKEEQKVLTEVGQLRVIATRDLAETIYQNRSSRMDHDMVFLRQHGLVEVNAVNARRDGRGGRVEHLEVVTLTNAGRNLVREHSGLPQDQKLYAGLSKPREVEHDSQIYRAYRKEAQRIEEIGGRNLRVRLDFELKAQVQKAMYAGRKADPDREMNEIKHQVAKQLDLPLVNSCIQIPDARIDYDLDQGSRSGHHDIEVLTAAYSPGKLRSKIQAGFHLYASSSDRSAITSRIESDHHLLDNILEF